MMALGNEINTTDRLTIGALLDQTHAVLAECLSTMDRIDGGYPTSPGMEAMQAGVLNELERIKTDSNQLLQRLQSASDRLGRSL